MAKVRIGFGSDFVVQNESVGIKTDTPGANLHVFGDIKSTSASTAGVSTFTSYTGFVDKTHKLETPTIDLNSQQHSLSGEIIIEGDVTVSSGTTVTSGPENLTVTDDFTLPMGGTESREKNPTAGTMRFNEDLASLEFYTGSEWRAVNSIVDMGNAGRGVFTGGYQATSATGRMEAINISSSGNTTYFGELVYTVRDCGAMGNKIRGLVEGTTNTNQIQYWTFATESNGQDFGDLTETKGTYNGSLASSTRGVWAGGWGGGSTKDTIEYVEIMTLGNAIDFGNLTVGARSGMAGCSNGTRGLFMGGHDGTFVEEIEQITISSKGNTTDFGKMSGGLQNLMCAGNTVRAIHGGGIDNDGSASSILEYITIASSGNATEFGDLITNRHQGYGVANQTRAVFASGSAPNHSNLTDLIEYVNISSLGNGVDFGGTTTMKCDKASAASNCHGGLGGF